MNHEEWATCHGTNGEGTYYVNRRTHRSSKTPWEIDQFTADLQHSTQSTVYSEDEEAEEAEEAEEEADDSFSDTDSDTSSYQDHSSTHHTHTETEDDALFQSQDETEENDSFKKPNIFVVESSEQSLRRAVRKKNLHLLMHAVSEARDLTHQHELLDFPMTFLRSLKQAADMLKQNPSALDQDETVSKTATPIVLERKKMKRGSRLKRLQSARLMMEKKRNQSRASGEEWLGVMSTLKQEENNNVLPYVKSTKWYNEKR